MTFPEPQTQESESRNDGNNNHPKVSQKKTIELNPNLKS